MAAARPAGASQGPGTPQWRRFAPRPGGCRSGTRRTAPRGRRRRSRRRGGCARRRSGRRRQDDAQPAPDRRRAGRSRIGPADRRRRRLRRRVPALCLLGRAPVHGQLRRQLRPSGPRLGMVCDRRWGRRMSIAPQIVAADPLRERADRQGRQSLEEPRIGASAHITRPVEPEPPCARRPAATAGRRGARPDWRPRAASAPRTLRASQTAPRASICSSASGPFCGAKPAIRLHRRFSQREGTVSASASRVAWVRITSGAAMAC